MNTALMLLPNIDSVLAWGVCATVLTTTVLEFSQFVGWSRLSMPFLFGTFFFADRRKAFMWGYVLYALGAWLFSIFYGLLFLSIGGATPVKGTVIGFFHGCFLVTVFLPSLAYFHPRMATSYDSPDEARMLEPPGAFGLNYGWGTPLVTMLSQVLFGLLLGTML